MRLTTGVAIRLVLAVLIVVVGFLAKPGAEGEDRCRYCTSCGGQHCCKEATEKGEQGWFGCAVSTTGESCVEYGNECPPIAQ